MSAFAALRDRLRRIWPTLDERTRRLVAANEATAWGAGGVSAVSRACGLARRVIRRGQQELRQPPALAPGRIRRPGGGRKPITVTDPTLVLALDELVAAEARGAPTSPLRWTCKSTRTLARTLTGRHHPVSPSSIRQLLHDLDCSLQANRKLAECTDHPDRDHQFRYINRTVKRALAAGTPVISVDTNYDPSGIIETLSPLPRADQDLRRWPVRFGCSP